MEISRDYEELFKKLNAHKIKYLVAGAYAVMYYSEPRFTKDIDVWIIPDLNDAAKTFEALKDFGAPLKDLTLNDLQNRKLIFQIGVTPVRIDIMMDVPGVDFKNAWKNRKKTKFGKTPINVLGLADIILAKKTAGRPQDRLDLEKLSKVKRANSN